MYIPRTRRLGSIRDAGVPRPTTRAGSGVVVGYASYRGTFTAVGDASISCCTGAVRQSSQSTVNGVLQCTVVMTKGPHREALVEPEVLPRCVGDPVASPGVCNLMGHNGRGGAVARDECWSHKRQAWVLHATVWEARRQHQEIVLAPHVWLSSHSLRCNIVSSCSY